MKKMGIEDLKIKPAMRPLTGLDIKSIMSIRTIKIPVHVGRITKVIKFIVVD